MPTPNEEIRKRQHAVELIGNEILGSYQTFKSDDEKFVEQALIDLKEYLVAVGDLQTQIGTTRTELGKLYNEIRKKRGRKGPNGGTSNPPVKGL